MNITLTSIVAAMLAVTGLTAGCSDGDDGSVDQSDAGSSQGGSRGDNEAGSSTGNIGNIGNTGNQGGEPSAAGMGSGGEPEMSEAGAGGEAMGGAPGAAGGAGEGGEGGEGEPNVMLDADDDVMLVTNDEGMSRAVYFFGRDLPGSATTAPVSNCVADVCKTAWPAVHSDDIVPAQGIAAADFSEFMRSDGVMQTTYKGWPLYFYLEDAASADREGQGIGSLWHAVEVPFFTLVIMRQNPGEDTGLYLANGAGLTLYQLLGDTPGTTSSDPVSTCTTTVCRQLWPVFGPNRVKAVPSLTLAFKPFIRPDSGELQLAYGGVPLYYYLEDDEPGELVGRTKPSWSLVTPAPATP
jgi:predicted lipoprotein with Yx(FWY)xxD motif